MMAQGPYYYHHGEPKLGDGQGDDAWVPCKEAEAIARAGGAIVWFGGGRNDNPRSALRSTDQGRSQGV
jgi:hypothetical protein